VDGFDDHPIAAALVWETYFVPKHPSPFFWIRVADVRASLGSPRTALELYEQVRRAHACVSGARRGSSAHQ
jgi:hypothetical protein